MVVEIFSRTINSIWPFIVVSLTVLIVTRIVFLLTHHKKVHLYKEVYALLFCIYILLLFELLTAADTNTYHGINLMPFTEITRYSFGSKMFYVNVVGNILIFIPFGLFISSFLKSRKVYSVFIVSLITSAVVELVQLRIGRSLDIDDIILNVLGSVIGYLLYVGLKAIKNKLPGFLKSELIYNIISIVIFGFIIFWFANRMGIV